MFNLPDNNLSALLLVFDPYSSQSEHDPVAKSLDLLPRDKTGRPEIQSTLRGNSDRVGATHRMHKLSSKQRDSLSQKIKSFLNFRFWT